MSASSIGDGTAPVYELNWGDHSVRTDEIPQIPEVESDDEKTHIGDITRADAIELVADMGREDEDCDVQLLGFE